MSATLGFVATLAEMEQFYRGDKAGQIIELMNKTNDIMDDVPWMEANQSDGHLTRIRTGLPAVYWRRLYQGTPPAKSQWSQVKEGCGILEAIMELDVEEMTEIEVDPGTLVETETAPVENLPLPFWRRWIHYGLTISVSLLLLLLAWLGFRQLRRMAREKNER